VVERGALKQTSLELRPPRLKALRLGQDANSKEMCFSYLTLSSGDTIKALCAKLVEAVAPDPEAKKSYRVWKIDNLEDDWAALEMTSSKLQSSGGKLLEEFDKTLEEADVESNDAFVVEFKQPNGWVVADSKPLPKPPITIAGRPGVPAPLFKSNEGFFNRMGNNASSSATSSFTKVSDDWKTPMARKEKIVEPGTLGLGNMCVKVVEGIVPACTDTF
jgi:ubiquitin carboxyl-terminal hydrolase 4/11/15